MNQIELIDKLCEITSELTDIVREQAYLLSQHGITSKRLDDKRSAALNNLDILEYQMREPFRHGEITGFDDAEIIRSE